MARATLAERSFKTRRDEAIKTRDWSGVEKAYLQYGTYLELIGGDAPTEFQAVVQFPQPVELEEQD